MNDFWEENKKKIITIGIIIVATIIITIINLFIGGSNSKQSPEEALEELGRAYYEDIYYPALTEQYADNYKILLGNYSESGMRVTLLTLLTSMENAVEELFINADSPCNLTESWVVIYPKGNFEIGQYDIEVNLVYLKEENFSTDNGNGGEEE